MTPQETFELWMRYQREAQKSNFASVNFTEASLESAALLDNPTITITRDALLRFRAAYLSLQAAVAELLGQPIEQMTVFSVMSAMARRAYEKSRCICADGGPGSYEGPMRDCPVHGENGTISHSAEPQGPNRDRKAAE